MKLGIFMKNSDGKPLIGKVQYVEHVNSLLDVGRCFDVLAVRSIAHQFWFKKSSAQDY